MFPILCNQFLANVLLLIFINVFETETAQPNPFHVVILVYQTNASESVPPYEVDFSHAFTINMPSCRELMDAAFILQYIPLYYITIYTIISYCFEYFYMHPPAAHHYMIIVIFIMMPMPFYIQSIQWDGPLAYKVILKHV